MARKFFSRPTLVRSLIIGALLAPQLSGARPAPWYWWVSKSTDDRVCFQTSPGQFWLREPQAFRDSRCSIRY